MTSFTTSCFRIWSFVLLFIAVNIASRDDHFVSAEIYFENGNNEVPLVKLTKNGGIFSGEVKQSRNGKPYNSFNGITYAVVPERFKASQPVGEDAWEGVQEAVKPGNICPQPKRQLDMAGGLNAKENCLNLNVHVPQQKTNNLPVMVWIHGGGFMFGNGFSYNPDYVMDQSNVILVTINYRLNVFGFFSTGDDVVPGNNGLKDLVLGLKWIQNHISAFGGNPESITIWGESAGGAAVHYLMLSPMAKGLFHRAVSASGTAMSLWAFQPKPKENAKKLATFVGCSGVEESKEIVDCLRKLSTEELVKAQLEYTTSWPSNLRPFYFGPTKESKDNSETPFLTIHPVESVMSRDGYVADVPYIIGATEDEGCVYWSGIVHDDSKLISELDTNWASVAPVTFDYGNYIADQKTLDSISESVRSFYFGNNAISDEKMANLTDVYSDSTILHSVLRTALSTAVRKDRKNPVYLYQYAYPGPISVLGATFNVVSDQAKKVGHGDDLQHQFNFLGLNKEPQSTKDLQFSERFIRLFTKFATTGYPTHPVTPSWGLAWEPLSMTSGPTPEESLKWYRISDEKPTMINISPTHLDRLQFWDQLWSRHIVPIVKTTDTPATATKSTTHDQKTEL